MQYIWLNTRTWWGGPFWWKTLGPGPLPPKSGADTTAECYLLFSTDLNCVFISKVSCYYSVSALAMLSSVCVKSNDFVNIE